MSFHGGAVRHNRDDAPRGREGGPAMTHASRARTGPVAWVAMALSLGSLSPGAPAAADSAPVASPAGPSTTLRYAVLTQGRPSGSLVAETGSDGAITIAYEYNDRGRGPKLRACVALDGQGLPVSLASEGVDYLKAPVEERFTHEGNGYSWMSGSEHGGVGGGGSGDPHAFYIAANATPFEIGLLARALQRAPKGVLSLLPEGEARLERVGERAGSPSGSSRATLTQVTISGLDFTPMRLWLDGNGTLFALLDPLFSVVREG